MILLFLPVKSASQVDFPGGTLSEESDNASVYTTETNTVTGFQMETLQNPVII